MNTGPYVDGNFKKYIAEHSSVYGDSILVFDSWMRSHDATQPLHRGLNRKLTTAQLKVATTDRCGGGCGLY